MEFDLGHPLRIQQLPQHVGVGGGGGRVMLVLLAGGEIAERIETKSLAGIERCLGEESKSPAASGWCMSFVA